MALSVKEPQTAKNLFSFLLFGIAREENVEAPRGFISHCGRGRKMKCS
jgi:hypothetical protein